MSISQEILSRLNLAAGSVVNVETVTRVDAKTGMCTVAFSRNSKTLVIPEGTSVKWGETLCKRALEDPGFANRMTEICDSMPAAKALGIKTYASSPIFLDDGELYGTLCAASADLLPIQEQDRAIVALYAKIIGQQVQRDRQTDAEGGTKEKARSQR